LTQNAENGINQIVDIDGLADALVMKKRTLLRRWRILPHFFAPMSGHDARAARFIVPDVIDHLKKTDGNYGSLLQQAAAVVGSQLPIQQNPLPQSRVQIETRGDNLGRPRTRQARGAANDTDPFNLLSGHGHKISGVVQTPDAT